MKKEIIKTEYINLRRWNSSKSSSSAVLKTGAAREEPSAAVVIAGRIDVVRGRLWA